MEANGVDFKFKTMAKISRFGQVSERFFKIIFCLTIIGLY